MTSQVTKALAGTEDLLMGTQTVSQTRGGVEVAVTGLSGTTLPRDSLLGPTVSMSLTAVEEAHIALVASNLEEHSAFEAALTAPSLGGVSSLIEGTSEAQEVIVQGFHVGLKVGGGSFYWEASRLKSSHNGGTVIDPTQTFPVDWANQTQVAAWFTPPTGSATGCWVRAKDTEMLVSWFGAIGDGLANDSLAVSATIDEALSSPSTVTFLPGVYLASFSKTVTSALRLKGLGEVLIKGASVLTGVFEKSADENGMTETSPFITITGLNFRSLDGNYCLTIEAQDTPSFIDTLELYNCKFWGRFGLKAVNLTTVTMQNNWFYNTAIGTLAESCTNWAVTNCKWRGASQKGFFITKNVASLFRQGGENIRFINCEFTVCTIGLHLDRHMWGVIDSCLFDYCHMPVKAQGSLHTKIQSTYLGAAHIASLTNDPDYVTASEVGIALFVTPFREGATTFTAGVSASQSEFISYDASAQPVVYLRGSIAAEAAKYVEQSRFEGCKFQMTKPHTAPSLLQISFCSNARIDSNQFKSYNLSSTLASPIVVDNSIDILISNTDSLLCRESDVEITSSFEKSAMSVVSMVDDAYGLEVQSKTGEVIASFESSGLDRTAMFFGGVLRPVLAGPNDSHSVGYAYVITPNS